MDLDGSVIAGVVAAGILAFVWYSSQSQPQKPTKKSRNSAKKIVEKAQVTIPGQFEPRDPLATITVGGSEGKKKKKNKGKGKAVDNGPGSSLTKYTPPATTTATTTTTPAPTTPAATTAPAPAPAPVPATDGNDTDSSWTHLERSQTTSQRPYAERVLSKSVRKTGVESMLPTPDYPPIKRVMRVVPSDSAKGTPSGSVLSTGTAGSGLSTSVRIPLPPAGFDSEPSPSDSAERSDEDSISPTRSRGGELGGARIDVGGDEDEDAGWGVVAPRGRGNKTLTIPLSSSSSSRPIASGSSTPKEAPLTKKQRQNLAKREKAKEAKADAEKERLELLARHRRERARELMNDRSKGTKVASNRTVGGGMEARVDESGRLVWE